MSRLSSKLHHGVQDDNDAAEVAAKIASALPAVAESPNKSRMLGIGGRCVERHDPDRHETHMEKEQNDPFHTLSELSVMIRRRRWPLCLGRRRSSLVAQASNATTKSQCARIPTE